MRLLRRLTEGVGAWLQFETHCNRRGLFSERYLSAPIGQILGAVYGSNVHAEVPHPILAKHRTGPGAPARLDFAAFDQDQKIIAAVESKWIGATKPNVEAIAWDLIRLELVASDSGAECCFLLGGRKKDLRRYFDSASFCGRSIGRTKSLLPFAPSQVRYRMRGAPPYRWTMHKNILQGWQNLDVPEVFLIAAGRPCPLDCNGEQFQVYGWSVRSVPDRVTFLPRDSRNYRSAANR